MKIARVYSDGSFIKIYEKGDRVKVVDHTGWLIENEELATVTDAVIDPQQVGVCIQTDAMLRGSWNQVNISNKSIEPYGKTLLEVPRLIQEWKESQVKTLLIGEIHAQNG